jgi:hypothetical protein
MTPAVPVLAGFLSYAFAQMPRTHRLRAPAAVVLLVATPVVVDSASRAIVGPPALPAFTAATDTPPDLTASTSVAYCRNAAAMGEIASLPRSVIFSSLNLGPAIIVYTPHAITSAGYHRSPAAYSNGIIAFQDKDALRAGLASSKADYLVICAGAGEEQLIARLEANDWPDWLDEVTGDRRQIRVFHVDKAALARDGAAP